MFEIFYLRKQSRTDLAKSFIQCFLVIFSVLLLSSCGSEKEIEKDNGFSEGENPPTAIISKEKNSDSQIGNEDKFIEGEEEDLEAVKEVAMKRLETLAEGDYKEQYELLHSDSKELISEKEYINKVAISKNISNLRIKRVDFIEEKYFESHDKEYEYVARVVGEFQVARPEVENGFIVTNDGSWYFVKDAQANNQWRILYDRF